MPNPYGPPAPYGQPPHGAAPPYGQPPYGPPVRPYGPPPVSRNDEQTWGLLAHLSVPFIGFLGPLGVYLAFKDRSPWLRETAAEALNFSILYTIAMTVSAVLFALFIGFLLFPVVLMGGLVLCILATVAASQHRAYRYPLNWRLIR